MAVCLPSLSDLRAERTLTEINQELRLQLAKYKQDFRDLTEKFLISQATSYSLANQLQKYKCEACKDIVESVLGEKLLFEVRRPAEKLAEKPTLDERLRTCATLIRSQARELTQLRQTLRDGKDDSVLLKQHLEDLLTRNDPDSHQGQGFRESLSEGYRVAKRLACKLSPEMYEDEEDEQAQEKLTPSMELQEVEKREVPEESKDECGLMPSSLQGSSDSHQPYSDDKFKFNELEVDLGQDGACGCSHAKEDEIPTKISDNENDHKQVSGQELTFPSVNLQDDEEKVVFQQSQDECVSVPSTLREGSACNQPSSDGEFAFDEENVASAVDGACGCSQAEEDEIPTGLPENQNDHDDLKSPEVVAPRFSRQLPQMRENGVPRDSLDEYYLTYSVLPDLSDSFWPYRSNAIFSPEDVDVSYARDVTKNLADLEDEEDQDIISSSVEQLVVEENEVQPDSLDECYLAASVGHHLAGSCHPYRSASFPTERREVFLALDVNGDTWEDCHRGPVSFPGSEVPTSQAQLQESTHVTDCLQWQLDQHFDCGDSKAMLGLSSTNGGFTSNPDSGNQGPLFLELGASISMKNPPKLQGEGSTASTHEHPVCNRIKGLSVLKQKSIRRKLLFGKWRLACRFPGLQA
ncbi:neuroblastoma breakpoint family member 4-like isoform X1 [Bos javanicus]|uniref:neuroblastoma breakpoint family member 4-like isoform X1 n=1 Tax=Bos javanicus TaxID=9906 RepID=UPI002AA8E4D2|nr:neuroblastoma breakpoint family member 4-like isoform X1 [Bos javanicus]